MKEFKLNLFNLVISLSTAVDLITPVVANHQKRVAYLASAIAQQLGLSKDEEGKILIAGALHDIGAVSLPLQERLKTLHFEVESPHKHAEMGYRLISIFEPFSDIAKFIRYHHVPWKYGEGSVFEGNPVPFESHILHLADRVDVLVQRDREVLSQGREICKKIEELSGEIFMPEVVNAFKKLAVKECFWLNLVCNSIDRVLQSRLGLSSLELDMGGFLSISQLFSQVVDFRSRFTSTHSSGVAATAEALARLVGFSDIECQQMRIAGYLHDLGKLAVPKEILEKPGKLTQEEFNVIKSHTFYTYHILEPIKDLEIINIWASFHHERLDGSGYPFHCQGKELTLGSRIMAVADVFTALTEDRPYREGMKEEKTIEILKQMVEASALDARLVSVLENHFDEINTSRISVQKASIKHYEAFAQS